ncbi:MAG: 3-methyl-2-oxobutanoate hydroxymethyltransferase [Pseudomonadota bacterium]
MRVTVPQVRQWKTAEEMHTPLVMVTAYDYTFAKLAEAAGIDILLVGDSLGMVIQGQSSTLPVTLDEVIYHTRCVSRGASKALVVADMPFLSYQISETHAIEAAGKLIKEGGAAAVKLEGGEVIAPTVRRLVNLDIPVMGHVGMTPQSIHRMGGFKVQGRHSATGAGSADQILRDAKALEEAGAFCVVIECVPQDLASLITSELSIPTIGIGAGSACDGQVLVSYDLLGLQTGEHRPKFLKQFAQLGNAAIDALATYADEVRSRAFPSPQESYEDTPIIPVLRAKHKKSACNQ